mmetsp:Transcript_1714/g.4159  ORF Transcript_1714/g.4159 Transcript_1714/m.4159 type:complete len:230 (+) Transcript_1714:6994-7683(+)
MSAACILVRRTLASLVTSAQHPMTLTSDSDAAWNSANCSAGAKISAMTLPPRSTILILSSTGLLTPAFSMPSFNSALKASWSSVSKHRSLKVSSAWVSTLSSASSSSSSSSSSSQLSFAMTTGMPFSVLGRNKPLAILIHPSPQSMPEIVSPHAVPMESQMSSACLLYLCKIPLLGACKRLLSTTKYCAFSSSKSSSSSATARLCPRTEAITFATTSEASFRATKDFGK